VTCIAGISQGGKVWLGGDSLGVRNGTKVIFATGKIWQSGEFLMGTCGVSRLCNLARYVFNPPALPADADLDAYMANEFSAAWRGLVKENGMVKTEDGAEYQEGMLLVGVRGALYEMDGFFGASRPMENYTAIGSGDNIALGALYATKGLRPEKRIKLALEAAAKWDDGVAGPFNVLSTRGRAKR
jgi:ATP-dependent protease HslVU (ClpYQ) peptidase subunit